MSRFGPAYTITLRVVTAGTPDATIAVASAVGQAGALLTGLDVVESSPAEVVVDVTCEAADAAHVDTLVAALESSRPGTAVHKVSDRTFLMHLGGKLEVTPKWPVRHRDELARVYTPGVARICEAIARHPADARRLTIKRNTVAVVTDGSAVLGLGNLAPAAALPVMEGKAALFKQFGGVDAWPVCLDTQDVDEIVAVVKAIAPVYGGINLEDISAPRCFEIERRLRAELDIPVFHDDQHGTAIVVLAALMNALLVVGKQIETARIVVNGIGAAGHAIVNLLLDRGAMDVVAVDLHGVLIRGDDLGRSDAHLAIASRTNPRRVRGSLSDALVGADVFIGVSRGNVLSVQDVAEMNEGAIVFALANPEPEIDPLLASRHAAVVATGRSDFPNQINNVLVFPGLFRGLLDSGAVDVTSAIMLAAARAISRTVSPGELSPGFVVPSVFNPAVACAVAEAVSSAAERAATVMPSISPLREKVNSYDR